MPIIRLWTRKVNARHKEYSPGKNGRRCICVFVCVCASAIACVCVCACECVSMCVVYICQRYHQWLGGHQDHQKMAAEGEV